MPALALNSRVSPIASQKKQARMRRVLESERDEVKAKLDTSWKRTKALHEKLGAAAKAGFIPEDLNRKLRLETGRSWKLVVRGHGIEFALHGLGVVDNAAPGARWRPTRAEPF
jgi:hypothetical protein